MKNAKNRTFLELLI